MRATLLTRQIGGLRRAFGKTLELGQCGKRGDLAEPVGPSDGHGVVADDGHCHYCEKRLEESKALAFLATSDDMTPLKFAMVWAGCHKRKLS